MIHKITKHLINWLAETWDALVAVVQRRLDEFWHLDLSELEKLGSEPDECLKIEGDK